MDPRATCAHDTKAMLKAVTESALADLNLSEAEDVTDWKVPAAEIQGSTAFRKAEKATSPVEPSGRASSNCLGIPRYARSNDTSNVASRDIAVLHWSQRSKTLLPQAANTE